MPDKIRCCNCHEYIDHEKEDENNLRVVRNAVGVNEETHVFCGYAAGMKTQVE